MDVSWNNCSSKPCLWLMISSIGMMFSHNLYGGCSFLFKVPAPDPLSSNPLYLLNIELSLMVASLYRLVQFGKAAYQNTRAHLRDAHTHFSLGTLRTSLLDRNLFRRIAFPTRLPGPLAAIDSSLDSLCRHEIETNLLRLRSLRESQAAGLGLLVSEGMDFSRGRDWKEGVVRGIDMMKSTMEWLPNVDVQSGQSTNHINEGTLASVLWSTGMLMNRFDETEVNAGYRYFGSIHQPSEPRTKYPPKPKYTYFYSGWNVRSSFCINSVLATGRNPALQWIYYPAHIHK